MRPGLILCAIGLHRWRHFEEPWTQMCNGREIQMKSARRECERCRVLEGYNGFLQYVGRNPWYVIDPKTGMAESP